MIKSTEVSDLNHSATGGRHKWVFQQCDSVMVNETCPRASHGTGKILKKVQVGKDQEKAQSERDSHSKNRGGKKPN